MIQNLVESILTMRHNNDIVKNKLQTYSQNHGDLKLKIKFRSQNLRKLQTKFLNGNRIKWIIK